MSNTPYRRPMPSPQARRKRIEPNRSRDGSASRRLEPVAESADRRDELRLGGVHFDPRAESLDVHVEGLRVPDVVEAPDPVDERVACHDSPGVHEQLFEKFEL